MTEVDKHYRHWVHERGKIGNYRNLSFSTTIREAFRAGYAVNIKRIAELEAQFDAMRTVLANVCDNLNDMPIDDEWAKDTVAKIEPFMARDYGRGHA